MLYMVINCKCLPVVTSKWSVQNRASNDDSRRLCEVLQSLITENTPTSTRAFSLLKAPTSTLTFKTLLRHFASRGLLRDCEIYAYLTDNLRFKLY